MNLKDFLIELRGNMTLKEASNRIGISLGYLRNLESGEKKNPSMEVLKKIADGYNCSFDEIMKLAGSEYTIETIEELGQNPQNPLEKVYQDKIKVVFNENVNVAYIDEDGNARAITAPTRSEIISRFYDIGFILEFRDRALYNGHPLSENDRQRILDMLKLLLPQYTHPKGE